MVGLLRTVVRVRQRNQPQAPSPVEFSNGAQVAWFSKS